MTEPRSPPEQHASSSFNLTPLTTAANMRQRPLGRAITTTPAATGFSEAASPSISRFTRRNSALSDTVSEARQSIRDSTDDLLFPRAKTGLGVGRGAGAGAGAHVAESHHDSHWQSAPLALALLPAVGGLFFQNGSAFVTDATLLILAAIFLNWSVRLPWNWYRSAQEIRQPPPESILSDDIIREEEEDEEEGDNADSTKQQQQPERKGLESSPSQAAIKELHMHEIAALISCFVFPLIGAWLLHAVRGALSRPSEGLVSNYNLTIFILAAEIRPFAHLLRMVQGRTLYLQRVVAAAAEEGDDEGIDNNKIEDLATRLEDLEAHVADKAAETATNSTTGLDGSTSGPGGTKPEVVAQIVAEVRQNLQPELDALNRAMRRYEKRTALMAYQIDTRINQIEAQVGDAIALAAAAQQSDRQSFLGTLLDWLIFIPARMVLQLVSLPGRVASAALQNIRALLTTGTQKSKTSKGKQSPPQPQTQPRSSISERRYIATPTAGSAVSGIRPVKKGS